MCLITFSYKQHPEYNLVLVANRDEFFQRPTQTLHKWPDHTHIHAGRDLLQGGTWLGLSSLGKFTAVTNYRNGVRAEEGKESRGKLTLDFLANEQTSAEYMQKIHLKTDGYGGFNLLTADESGVHYLSNSGGGYKVLDSGLYGLSNAHLDTQWPKVQAAKDALAMQLAEIQVDPSKLGSILQDNTQVMDELLPETGVSLEWERLLSSRFIKAEEYGTRCTTVLLQSYTGDTHILEKSYDSDGEFESNSFDLKLPVFGGV